MIKVKLNKDTGIVTVVPSAPLIKKILNIWQMKLIPILKKKESLMD